MCEIVESRCETCGKYFFFERDRKHHKCPPKWQVWEDEGGDEDRRWSNTIFADQAYEAAEKYAEQQDAYGDYTCIGGTPMTVFVASDEEATPVRFEVTGEAVPEYTARELKTTESREG